ncbi:MAG: ATP-binding protein [Pseudomonadota bacterium]
MGPFPKIGRHAVAKAASPVLGIIVGIVAFLGLASDVFAPSLFGESLPGPAVTRMTMALFIVSAVILTGLRPRSATSAPSTAQRRFGWLGIALVTVPATLMLGRRVLTDSHQFGFSAPVIGLCFAVVGVGISCAMGSRIQVIISRFLASVLFLAGMATLLGYTYGAPTLTRGFDGVTFVPVMTAIGLLMLAIAIVWLRPEQGFPALLSSETVVGAQFRALVPMVLGPPLLVGAAVSSGYSSLFEGPLAIALTSLGSVAAAGLVGGLSLVVIGRSDSELTLKTQALDSARNAIAIFDNRRQEPVIQSVNGAFERVTGFARESVLGASVSRLVALDEVPEKNESVELMNCVLTCGSGTFEAQLRRHHSGPFWAKASVSQVRNARDNLNHTVVVIDDVTQARRDARALEAALESSRQANAMRATFVRVISHELRTPLNAALTWIRLMEVDRDDATVEEGMRVVAQSIDSQSRLIDDLSDAARFESSGVRLEKASIDLAEAVQGVVDELRPVLEAHHSFSFDAGGCSLTVEADLVRIQQICRNLLTNAVKYTPHGGSIHCRLAKEPGVALLAVSDTGKGLSESEIKSVFDPFWRAPSSQPGAGVGLFVVAMLAEAHGGSASVTSDGANQGTTFSIRLPLSDSSPPDRDQGGFS